jgi:hypothetical protein
MQHTLGQRAINAVDFKAGVTVLCQDGQRGRLAQVIVEPASGAVTHLVVECGPLGRSGRLLPVALVESATQEGITLAVASDVLEEYGENPQSPAPPEAIAPPQQRDAEPSLRGAYYCAIRPAPPVLTLREKLRRRQGRLRRLPAATEASEEDEVTHLFVRQGAIFTDKWVIPIFVLQESGVDDFSRGDRPTLAKANDIPLLADGEGEGRPFWREPQARAESGLPA